jgi:transcription initiation factor TFIID subunit TAF12
MFTNYIQVPSEPRHYVPSRQFQQQHHQLHQQQQQQRHVPPPAPMTKAESIGGYPPDLIAHSNFQVNKPLINNNNINNKHEMKLK